MVRARENETILDFSWNQMVQAVYQKYPNPHNKNARVSDILNRSVDSENRICSERYSGNEFPVPDIINSTFYTFTGIRFPRLGFSYEYSILDKKNSSLKQFSHNYTMGSFLRFIESIEYSAHGEGQCKMKQTWHVYTLVHPWIDGWFEDRFLGICQNNAKDGINGVKWVADKLNSGDAGIINLNEFREKLKIFYEENIEKTIEDTIETVQETVETVQEEIQEKSGEITKKIEELYCETQESIEHAICDEVPKTVERIRNYSESKNM